MAFERENNTLIGCGGRGSSEALMTESRRQRELTYLLPGGSLTGGYPCFSGWTLRQNNRGEGQGCSDGNGLDSWRWEYYLPLDLDFEHPVTAEEQGNHFVSTHWGSICDQDLTWWSIASNSLIRHSQFTHWKCLWFRFYQTPIHSPPSRQPTENRVVDKRTAYTQGFIYLSIQNTHTYKPASTETHISTCIVQ